MNTTRPGESLALASVADRRALVDSNKDHALAAAAEQISQRLRRGVTFVT